MKTTFINTSGYRFVTIPPEELPGLKAQLAEEAQRCGLKGTILLSEEGINSFLSGTRAEIDAYQAFLNSISYFAKMWHKESESDHQPFTRMLVRLKKEIIAMGRTEIAPEKKTAPHIPPEALKQWFESGKKMRVLDTRNDYEVALGTFQDAVDLNIETFRDFPDALALLPESEKELPVVTFCTGGIRCEKAAQHMLNQGFKEVYQLEGGILNYFEQCGGDHYEGECFVFDKRVAVNSALEETETQQCYACRGVLLPTQVDQACVHCGHKTAD
jgi:predicted sulfurtransferase